MRVPGLSGGMNGRPILQLDDVGDVVRELQALLIRHGFDPGPVDAHFGPMTEAAVRAFQQARGLDADGIVGPLTWAALLADGGQIGEAGLTLIKVFEGFSGSLYNDPAGHCTIGYGHLVHLGPCDGSEPAEFRAGISEGRATELLLADVAEASATVGSAVVVPLNQHQFDALVSFTFNVGSGSFRDSTLLRLLNGGDYASVPNELNRWVFADGKVLPGLERRRRAEGTLFRDGVLLIAPRAMEDETEVIEDEIEDEKLTPRPTIPPGGP